MFRKLLAVVLIVAIAIGIFNAFSPSRASATVVAAPAAYTSMTASHPQFLDKTRFLAHMALAYGAFHHWVWKPYKAGKFKSGASGRIVALVKAGAALLFAYHEMRVAYDIAKKSNSDLLHTLIKPLDLLSAKAQQLANNFKGGGFSTSALEQFNNDADTLGKLAGGIGDASAIPGF